MGFYSLTLPWLLALQDASKEIGALEPKDAEQHRIPATAYLATYRFLLTQAEMGYDLRQDIVIFIDEVRPHWNALKDDPLVVKIDALTNRDAEMRAAEARGDIKRVPRGFEEFGDRDYRLQLTQAVPGNRRSVSVRELVATVTTTGDALLTEVCTSNRAMLGVIHALRTFDDTCIRYVAARRVEADTGTPLIRVLALWRSEGNLCVFPSMSSILRRIPSGVLTGRGEAWDDAQIARVDAKVEGTKIGMDLRPNIAHWVWLADDTASAVQALDVPAQKDDHIKNLALASGFLAHAIGCDLLAGRSPNYARNALTFDTAEFRHVSTGYWRFTKPDTTEADAADRWRLMIANLRLERAERIDGQLGPKAVIVAPSDPVQHIVRILTEGVRLLRYFDFMQTLVFKDSSATTLPGSPRVPIAIAYLRYNQQHNPEDSGTAGYVLATLLRVWNYRKLDLAPPTAQPLFQAILNSPGFPAFLDTIGTDIDKQYAAEKASLGMPQIDALRAGKVYDPLDPAAKIHSSAARAEDSESPIGSPSVESPHGERMTPALHGFMTTAGNAELVWEYIETVPRIKRPEGWPTWWEPRQNATRHRRLHDFYRLVFE